MTIYLVQCGQTDWQLEGRMQGRISLPLSAAGQEQAKAAAAGLAGVELTAIYRPDCEACQQTARAIWAGHRGRKLRRSVALHEVDLGLWQGMLTEEVQHRQPRVYRQWIDEPTTVIPPGGEGFEQAFERLVAAVRKILKRRQPADNVAVVVPPLAAALIRCHFKQLPLSEVWKVAGGDQGVPEAFPALPEEKG